MDDITGAPEVRCETLVRAGWQRLWELVTDIGLPARLSPELQRVAWLDSAREPAVGACFEGFNRHSLVGEWRTVSRVVELDEPRTFAWAVVDADGRFGEPNTDPARALASWRFDLREDGDGVLLSHTVRVGPGRSGLTLAIERAPERRDEIVAYRVKELRAGMEATLDGIRQLAETPA
ncbi:SRPBCC family protein [Streptomyces sp. NPDC003327]